MAEMINHRNDRDALAQALSESARVDQPVAEAQHTSGSVNDSSLALALVPQPDEEIRNIFDQAYPAVLTSQTSDAEAAPGGAAPDHREPTSSERSKQEVISAGAKFERLDEKTLIRVQSVFVTPPGYDTRNAEAQPERVVVVHGPDHAGKRSCAIHLGLRLYGATVRNGDEQINDSYQRYINGLAILQEHEKQYDSEHGLSPLDARLLEVINQLRIYGEHNDGHAELNRLIVQLDRPSYFLFNKRFIDICELHQKRAAAAVNFVSYHQPLRDVQSLIDLFEKLEPAEKRVCIIENIFDASTLTPETIIPRLRTIAADKHLSIVLTTTLRAQRFADLDVPLVAVEAVEAGRATFMKKVLEAHLHYYRELYHIEPEIIKLVSEHKETFLKEHLDAPAHINLFCAELSNLPTEAELKDVAELAGRIGRVSPSAARAWFQKLKENARLYAMLIHLFPGLGRLMMDEIYTLAVSTLRQDGFVSLRDPRGLGTMDMLRLVRAHEDETQVVFNMRVFEEEVASQIHNYHHLLWSLLQHVLPHLVAYLEHIEDWALRRALGCAIGRVGVYHQYKLLEMLRTLALSPHGGVVIVTGYALDEMCRMGARYYSFVEGLLKNWISSRDADLIWAAGAAIRLLYDGLAEAVVREQAADDSQQSSSTTLIGVWASLALLAERFDDFENDLTVPDDQSDSELSPEEWELLRKAYRERLKRLNLRCLLDTLCGIALSHPDEAVPQLQVWLTHDKKDRRRQLAELAGQVLFERLGDPDAHLLQARHEVLLDLVEPLLLANKTTVRAMIDSLLRWLPADNWAVIIQRVLLRIATHASPGTSRELRNWLVSRWCERGSEEARQIARSIIGRSYALADVALDVPGRHAGVLVLDNSVMVRGHQSARRISHQLYERLNGQADMYLVALGEARVLAGPGHRNAAPGRLGSYPRPRLLGPALDQLDPASIPFVVVLTWGNIIDFDDVWHSPWRDRLIVVSPPQTELPWPDALQTMIIDRALGETDLPVIEEMVHIRQAHFLSSLSPAAWYADMQMMTDSANPSGPACEQALTSWIAQLDDLASLQPGNDVARRINCTLVWLATVDVAACVGLIRAWLTGEDAVRKRVGGAAGRALFRLFANAQPLASPARSALLLDLIEPLAAESWQSVEAVLYAVRRWLPQPEWVEHLHQHPDRLPNTLFRLIDGVLPEHKDQLSRTLKAWDKPLRDEHDQALSAQVRALADQLMLRLNVGINQPLSLPEGVQYGLIIIDTAPRSPRLRLRLAKIASQLAQRINSSAATQTQALIHALGLADLLAAPGETPDVTTLIPTNLTARPRLIGPLLERYDVGRVSFVLVLTDEPFLDEQDWYTTLWSGCGWVYREEDRRSWRSPFRQLERPHSSEDVVETILKQLALV